MKSSHNTRPFSRLGDSCKLWLSRHCLILWIFSLIYLLFFKFKIAGSPLAFWNTRWVSSYLWIFDSPLDRAFRRRACWRNNVSFPPPGFELSRPAVLLVLFQQGQFISPESLWLPRALIYHEYILPVVHTWFFRGHVVHSQHLPHPTFFPLAPGNGTQSLCKALHLLQKEIMEREQ